MMPRVALAICLLWFLSLFVFRSVVQWRRTGSTGMKGFHGRVGSLPWVAGVTASLGLALSPAAPLGVLLGWPGATLLLEAPSLHALGAVLALAGTLGAFAAQLSMGDSWRIGVDDAETTRLVTDGPLRLGPKSNLLLHDIVGGGAGAAGALRALPGRGRAHDPGDRAAGPGGGGAVPAEDARRGVRAVRGHGRALRSGRRAPGEKTPARPSMTDERCDRVLPVLVEQLELDVLAGLDALEHGGVGDLEGHRHRLHQAGDVAVIDRDLARVGLDGLDRALGGLRAFDLAAAEGHGSDEGEHQGDDPVPGSMGHVEAPSSG